MATIRKYRGKFNVQIRRKGYPFISRTFANLTTAKRWATATEADMERNLYVAPAEGTLEELLDRNEKEISPRHKSHAIEACRLKTLKKHLGDEIGVAPSRRPCSSFSDPRILSPLKPRQAPSERIQPPLL